ncbi:hypothetical protein QJS10_CPB04g01126 [Acorus calamus]|uniref:Uncharacterized protein n=1 Tax=Acorus calamus TaxID=4465 RepID=A0AAV9EXM0_ACOCL|nr:hypothetical protein QJS10_CPB04g01126 [Acorus calamus]
MRFGVSPEEAQEENGEEDERNHKSMQHYQNPKSNTKSASYPAISSLAAFLVFSAVHLHRLIFNGTS